LYERGSETSEFHEVIFYMHYVLLWCAYGAEIIQKLLTRLCKPTHHPSGQKNLWRKEIHWIFPARVGLGVSYRPTTYSPEHLKMKQKSFHICLVTSF